MKKLQKCSFDNCVYAKFLILRIFINYNNFISNFYSF